MRMSVMLPALAVVAVLGFAGGAWAQSAGGANARYNACSQDAIAKSLSGDARRASIEQCLGTPMAQSAAPKDRSYGECRSGAISRGLTGDQLRVYLDRCMNS